MLLNSVFILKEKKMFVRLLPVLFSTLLISAHFMRAYGYLIGSLFLLLLFTLFIRKIWIIRLWQILLSLAAITWIFTTINLINLRIEIGQPWLRLAIILGAIIVFTVWSALWLKNKRINAFYNKSDSD